MNIRLLLMSFIVALALPACERIDKAAQEQAAAEIKPIPSEKYDKDGLVFEYPVGWNVIDDSTQEDVRYVFIESDEGAVSVIQVFKVDEAPTLDQFATSYSEQTQVIPELPEGEAAATPQAFAPSELMTITRELDGKTYDWVVESVPGQIAGIATSDYREYFKKDSERFSAFLINQVNNDILTANEGSFELIFKTLTPMQ